MLRRPRRNRKSQAIRNAVRETHLSVSNLVMPLFMLDGKNRNEKIHSLPIASRQSVDQIIADMGKYIELGLDKFILFPVVDDKLKDSSASYALDPDNFYLKGAKMIKEAFPEVSLISDVAMDPYSSDGHDGIVDNGKILNDETLEVLEEMAVIQADAGFDIIGPSDMMDHRVQAIRLALDDSGHEEVSIMSYTAKYASAFYGPFRDALDSVPKFGDKKSYQMDPGNKNEAITEAELDIDEGADFIMVKPALHYLDVIHLLKNQFEIPVAAYHVSGECSMLLAASEKGWLDLSAAVDETLLSIKRSGADIIITYFAYEYALRHRK